MDFILYLCEVDSKESHKICRHAEFIKSFETCLLVRIRISPDLPTCLLNKDLHPEKRTDWPFFLLEIPGLAYFPLISKLLFALSGSWSEIRVLKQRLSLFPTPTCSFLCNSPGTKLLYLSSGDPQFLILQMFQMSKKSKLSSATSAGYTLYKLLLKSKLGKRKL